MKQRSTYNLSITESRCSKKCTCSGDKINCSHRNLESVPDAMSDSVTVVNLAHNQISSVTKNDFAGCINLKILNLTSNSLSTIERRAFADCRSLEHLRLDTCRLHVDRLPADIFDGPRSLQQLSIHNNKQGKTYRGKLFENLTDLRSLAIDGLPLAVFPTEFSNLTSLRELKIYGGLESVGNLTFSNFSTTPVETLIIRAPRDLRSLEPLSFSHFRNLKKLDLRDNQLLGLKNASRAYYGLRKTQIRSLSLSVIEPENGNNINLTAALFPMLNETSIEVLSLSGNNVVKMLPNWPSAFPPTLKCLELQSNRLLSVVHDVLMHLSQLRKLESINLNKQICNKLSEGRRAEKDSDLVPFFNEGDTEFVDNRRRCRTYSKFYCNSTKAKKEQFARLYPIT